MPVLNLNGVERKQAKVVKGTIFGATLVDAQHPTLGFVGKTYNSPFTESGKSVFNSTRNDATTPHLAALQVESPGRVVPAKTFVKIHPHEKGSHFASVVPERAVVKQAGGPSKLHDTAANPNKKEIKQKPRPVRNQPKLKPETKTNLSFVRSGGTLGGHPDPQAGTSSGTSRWSVVKRGAAG